MTDRDHFAAAALTGFIRGMPDATIFHLGLISQQSYGVADAMLRERGNHSEKLNSSPNLDAVPEARAESDEARTDKAATSHRREGTGNTQGPSSPQWLDFNCNDRVRVKLTDHGREVLKHQHQLLNAISTYLPYRPPVEDSEGWSEWQLWRLMEAFGEKTGMGLPMCFHPVIQILADRVTNPTKPRNSALGEPVAWMGRAARIDGGDVTVLRLSRADAETDVHDAETCEPREIVPLYRHPQPTLTDAEREAVQWAIDALVGIEDFSPGAVSADASAAATLRKLQERLK